MKSILGSLQKNMYCNSLLGKIKVLREQNDKIACKIAEGQLICDTAEPNQVDLLIEGKKH